MSPITRDLMLRAIDGRPELPAFMFHVKQMRQCDKVLVWLLDNRLTGQELVRWLNSWPQRSYLGPINFILKRIEKDATGPRAIKVGRDWLG